MAERSYPPPPPPPEGAQKSREFHLPATHFFNRLLRHLTPLESQLELGVVGKSLKKGLIVGLILGATLTIVITLVLELLIGNSNNPFVNIVLAPFMEEIFKALSVFLVVFLMWKNIPSRRYGAALGAAVGLGFALSETIIRGIIAAGVQNISGGLIADAIISRIISEPFMHPLWSAFVGIGIFVLFAQKSNRQGSPYWLAIPFLLVGLLNHILWNSLAFAFVSLDPLITAAVELIVIFVPFAFIMRDFLGGHFNFQIFFKPPAEVTLLPDTTRFMPPPPPPSFAQS